MTDLHITQGGTARGGGLQCGLKKQRDVWVFWNTLRGSHCIVVGEWDSCLTPPSTYKWYILNKLHKNLTTPEGPGLPCECTSLHWLPEDNYNIKKYIQGSASINNFSPLWTTLYFIIFFLKYWKDVVCPCMAKHSCFRFIFIHTTSKSWM